MDKSMMLVTSSWGNNKTFKMIPVTPESVYNEAIFDLDSKVLALISKEKKESMHMVAKLNDMGDPEFMKIGKRENGKNFKEERKLLETFYEYYVEDKNEVINMINLLAINADSFDYMQYIDFDVLKTAPKSNILTGI